jgi:pimeloyl-ACP methyl ester carboxylesterase
MTHSAQSVTITTTDGVALAVQIVGEGEPIVFVHEFSGNLLSWTAQVTELGRRYKCVSFSARGYPPSQVPHSPDAFTQERAADDIADVMGALGIASAHVIGLSMGGFAALHAAIRHPGCARSLVIAGCGYGSKPSERADYSAAMHREADHAESIGMMAYAAELADSTYAKLLRAKDEAAWKQFADQLSASSVTGMAMTLRGVLARRPSLWEMGAELARISSPVLLVVGDEDQPCIEPSLFLKSTLPDCALCVMPRTGHLPNLEEPRNFNALVEHFIISVSNGRWSQTKTSVG